MTTTQVFTDGCCKGNQYVNNTGGYGAVIIENGQRNELSQGYKNTTNIRMELRAIIAALSQVKQNSKIELYSDCEFICNAFNKGWLGNWRTNGWKKTNKKKVGNISLWQELIPLVDQLDINFIWVKGHDGNAGNERADRLANHAAASGNLLEDSGPMINHS